MPQEEDFTFASSSNLKLPVSLKIGNLEGFQKPIPYSSLLQDPEIRHHGSNANPHSELYVTVRLWSDSKPLTLPVQTAYKVFKTSRTWNEWLSLPISYSQIPANSQLAITIWDHHPKVDNENQRRAVPFGGTTVPLFGTDFTLLKGRQRCRVHRHVCADGYSDTTTPFQIPKASTNGTSSTDAGKKMDQRLAEMERLDALMKKHEMGEISENKWLDQLVFRQIEKLQRSNLKSQVQLRQADDPNNGGDNSDDDGLFYLYIDFPRFDHPVVFTDKSYPAPPISTMQLPPGEVRLKPPPEVSFGPGINMDRDPSGQPAPGRLIKIYDPEVGIKDNPAENKHRRLVRSTRTGVLDRELKPNAKIRDDLNMIMGYGPLQDLNDEEKDMVWKFRHHLTKEKRALTKLVKSVTWTDPGEVREAISLLSKWTTIDVDDALELLGPSVHNPEVRAYAVDRLRKSDDDELLLYLLQLVQALRFERPQSGNFDSSLARFLITRAADNFILGNYLHWYLMVECDDRIDQDDNTESRSLFAKVEYDFMTELMTRPDGPEVRKTLLRQGQFVTMLSRISLSIRNLPLDRPRKIQALKKELGDPKNELTTFDPPLPLPLDPTISIVGVVPDQANVFKSSLLPLNLTFSTVGGQPYHIIFKTGDDLRQDQLVIQIITLMDRLLLKENLDLKLSPYHILATAPTAGAVQFVPSSSVSSILSKYNKSILPYLQENHPDPIADLGVSPSVMDTYVKSLAGYCVITYLLGVGDRHLENLLLTPDGYFFHVDFGYILGRDPKPFAPLMKLDRTMIVAMGGEHHENYAKFKQYCFTAYASLRKSANLILNLFALMSESSVPDIRMEPDKAVEKVQERFHLEMSEEEAMQAMEGLIETSVNALMPVFIDKLHDYVQMFRT